MNKINIGKDIEKTLTRKLFMSIDVAELRKAGTSHLQWKKLALYLMEMCIEARAFQNISFHQLQG